MTVDGTVVAAGTDAKLATSGDVCRRNGDAAPCWDTLAVNGRGEGTLGPITLDGPGGRTLYARVALDRPHAGGGAAFVAVHDFTLATSARPTVAAGLRAAARAAGVAERSMARWPAHSPASASSSAATPSARNVVALGYPIDDLTFHGNVRDGARVQAPARYRGSLDALGASRRRQD